MTSAEWAIAYAWQDRFAEFPGFYYLRFMESIVFGGQYLLHK